MHANTVLAAVLTPNRSPQNTMRDILVEGRADLDSGNITIGKKCYYSTIIGDKFHENYGLVAKERDLVFFRSIESNDSNSMGSTATPFGYIQDDAVALTMWAITACKIYKCAYRIELQTIYH
jgi:hypothetical protein